MTYRTMKRIDCGNVMIHSIDPQLFADLIACARIGADGADDAIGSERADAVWALIDKMEKGAAE